MKISHPLPSQIDALRRLWQEAFGDDNAFLDHFFSLGFSCDHCRCITTNGQVAAALYWFDCTCGPKTYAYLYAVATDRNFRGQGLCHRLMADTHGILQQRGYAGAILVPATDGLFSFYASMGYTPFGGMDRHTYTAQGAPAQLEQLTISEYARLRRQYLPEGGVRQEGPLLDFLSSWTQFYRGEDFLLAAAKDGDKLLAAELLGNRKASGSVLAALNLPRGHFRFPGSQPFAMGLAFGEEELPGYFGLALD